MAKPITHTRLLALLTEWNLPYETVSTPDKKWYENNRNHKGPWGPINGSMIHHTGSMNQDSMVTTLRRGYDGLPGPLCHGGIDLDGIIHLVGWGRANHAGLGSETVLNHVTEEDWDGRTLRPGPANVDGNSRFYGWEVMYNGKKPMTEKQYITTIRLQAALMTEHGWTEKSVIGHGEWQQGKWDPGLNGRMMNMGDVRYAIRQAIKEGPKPKLPTRPKPVIHTVAKGDTLSGIARKYGVELAALINANPALLQVGDKLTIPKK